MENTHESKKSRIDSSNRFFYFSQPLPPSRNASKVSKNKNKSKRKLKKSKIIFQNHDTKNSKIIIMNIINLILIFLLFSNNSNVVRSQDISETKIFDDKLTNGNGENGELKAVKIEEMEILAEKEEEKLVNLKETLELDELILTERFELPPIPIPEYNVQQRKNNTSKLEGIYCLGFVFRLIINIQNL